MNFIYTPKQQHIMTDQIYDARGNINYYYKLSELEYENIKEYVPNKINNVLDLGCGLGRVGTFFNYKRQDPEIHYIFADSTDNKPSGGWNTKLFYNNLEETEEFIKNNGVVNYTIFDIRKDNWESLPKIDLVLSMFSAGGHYPITDYIDILDSLLTENGCMIFGGVSDNGLNDWDILKSRFHCTLTESNIGVNRLCRYLIIQKFRD